MKKFFGSAKTLFLLLLLLSKALPATTTMGKIDLTVELYQNEKPNPDNKDSYVDSLQLNITATKNFIVSVDLTNDKHYFNQVLNLLNKQYPNTRFFFPWTENDTNITHQLELKALARSSFPITKQCPKGLLINAVKKNLLNEELTTDPLEFFEKSENRKSEWAESEVNSTATSTVSKSEPPLPFTTTGDRPGTDSHTNTGSDVSSETSNKEQKKGGTLLKYGGALLLVSILTGGCYALYRSLTSPKGGGPEQEKEQEEEEEEGSLI